MVAAPADLVGIRHNRLMHRVATTLRSLRQRAGLPMAGLASLTHAGRGWIANIERGERWPSDRRWVEAADTVLDGNGELLRAWEADKDERDERDRTAAALAASARHADALLAMPDAVDLDTVNDAIAELAVRYLYMPPAPMLADANLIQTELLRRLSSGAYRPQDQHDLYVAVSRTAGILAYAALDLGNTRIAARHAFAGFKTAALAGHHELQAWTRGTQSLIARFDRRFDEATRFITDGLRYADPLHGTAGTRLHCGAAQCAANLGDLDTTIAALNRATADRVHAAPDEVGGIFGFPIAKQFYYAGSSLMWLPDRDALTRAVHDAGAAIDLWQHEPADQRNLDDEALAHIYQATAYIRLGDIDAGMNAVQPILDLPVDRQISWITRRLAELASLIAHGPYGHTRRGKAAYEQLTT